MRLAGVRGLVKDEMKEVEEVLQKLIEERFVIFDHGRYKIFCPSSEYVCISMIGLSVENAYSGIENILLSILSLFDEKYSSEQWHKELLTAAREKTEHRDNIISKELYHELDKIRKFRHVVRKKYPHKYDPEFIYIVGKKIFYIWKMFKNEVCEFLGICSKCGDVKDSNICNKCGSLENSNSSGDKKKDINNKK